MKLAPRVPAWVILWLLPATSASGSTVLNFPRLSFEQSTFTGIAFVNTGTSPATVFLTVYGQDGVPAAAVGFQNPAELTIPAGRQVAKTAPEIFKGTLSPDFVGWIRATSHSDGIAGFFLYLNGAVSFLDGADLPSSGNSIVFHSVGALGDYEPEINIINPNLHGSELALELIRPVAPPLTTSDVLEIPPMGMVRLEPRDYFEVADIPPGSYLRVNGTNGIVGFEFVRTPSGELYGLNAKPAREQMSRLYIPQFAVLGPWETKLSVVNHSQENVVLTISALEAGGRLFSPGAIQQNPVLRALEAGQSLTEDVGRLFGFGGDATKIGWLKIESTSPAVHGFVSYGVPSTGSVAAVSAQPVAQTQFLFSHIASDLGYFTGLSLLNTGTLAANFRVVASTPEGEIIGRYSGILGSRERLSKVIQELIPEASSQTGGFIWVKSDLPLYATSLFGTSQVLANIPPQPALEVFVPDSDQARPEIQPRLAVLQPGKSIQFSSSGFSGPVGWAVNGTAGGNSELGQISPAGVYTAPPQLSASRSLDISASALNATAAASLDLLRKEELLSGIGTIQAVAYLSSLRKIFTAEIIGFDPQDESGKRSPAESQSSQIFASYPTRLRTAEFPGEFISGMIRFVSSGGQEFLLLAARESGRVLRLDPATGQSVPVINWLTAPTALVLDPTTGNLLVADQDAIKSFPPRLLELGLSLSAQSGPTPHWKHSRLAGNFVSLVGLAADICTGDLYVTEADGSLIKVARTSGEKEIVDSGRKLTSLLGIYRSEVPCPAAFHLLASDRDESRVELFVPSSDVSTIWLENATANDLAFLPPGNTATASGAILLGLESELQPSEGELALIPVGELYSPPSEAPVSAVVALADPAADTFGPASPQYDIVSADAEIRGGVLYLTVGMRDAFDILTIDSEGTELSVGIEFDIDQDPNTGFQPVFDDLYPSAEDTGLGVEYGVETEVDPSSGTVPVYSLVGSGVGFVVRSVPIQVGQTSLTLSIPISTIDVGRCVNFIIEAGYYDAFEDLLLTDVAPNLGHFTVCQ